MEGGEAVGVEPVGGAVEDDVAQLGRREVLRFLLAQRDVDGKPGEERRRRSRRRRAKCVTISPRSAIRASISVRLATVRRSALWAVPSAVSWVASTERRRRPSVETRSSPTAHLKNTRQNPVPSVTVSDASRLPLVLDLGLCHLSLFRACLSAADDKRPYYAVVEGATPSVG